MHNDIIGILLAAGQSKRFGSQKLLHPSPDSQTPIAVQSAQNLVEVLPNSVAVIRENNLALKSLLLDTGIDVLENPDARLGMSSSIRCAIQSKVNSQDDIKGWVIALADMPYISAPVIEQISNAIAQGALIAAPFFNNQRGHPVGFSTDCNDELLTLQGDTGAKSIIKNHQTKLHIINTSSDGILRDINYMSDLTD